MNDFIMGFVIVTIIWIFFSSEFFRGILFGIALLLLFVWLFLHGMNGAMMPQ